MLKKLKPENASLRFLLCVKCQQRTYSLEKVDVETLKCRNGCDGKIVDMTDYLIEQGQKRADQQKIFDSITKIGIVTDVRHLADLFYGTFKRVQRGKDKGMMKAEIVIPDACYTKEGSIPALKEQWELTPLVLFIKREKKTDEN